MPRPWFKNLYIFGAFILIIIAISAILFLWQHQRVEKHNDYSPERAGIARLLKSLDSAY